MSHRKEQLMTPEQVLQLVLLPGVTRSHPALLEQASYAQRAGPSIYKKSAPKTDLFVFLSDLHPVPCLALSS